VKAGSSAHRQQHPKQKTIKMAPLSPLTRSQSEACVLELRSSLDANSRAKVSLEECIAVTEKRCLFGENSFGTVPAMRGATSAVGSPPGLSRAALRRERDSLKASANPNARFVETQFGTVPKTPSGASGLQNLAKAFGSPPGLSRSEMRKERDACKAANLPTKWTSRDATADTKSSGFLLTPESDKHKTATDRLREAKQESAWFKDLRSGSPSSTRSSSEATPLRGTSSSSGSMTKESSTDSLSELLASTTHRCCFGTTDLGTVPSASLWGESKVPSPPGLSRKALRQARDSCKGKLSSDHPWTASAGTLLTIKPSGVSLPKLFSNERRRLAEGGLATLRQDISASVPSLHRLAQEPR